jgi:hypothetical protein
MPRKDYLPGTLKVEYRVSKCSISRLDPAEEFCRAAFFESQNALEGGEKEKGRGTQFGGEPKAAQKAINTLIHQEEVQL